MFSQIIFYHKDRENHKVQFQLMVGMDWIIRYPLQIQFESKYMVQILIHIHIFVEKTIWIF